MDERRTDPEAVDRFQSAREERDLRASRYEAAGDSPGELSAYTELQAAEQQLAARQAWLNWSEEDH